MANMKNLKGNATNLTPGMNNDVKNVPDSIAKNARSKAIKLRLAALKQKTGGK